MLTSVAVLAVLAGALGALLVWAARAPTSGAERDIERVNALLPQTQCAQCGYPGCRPYAAAIVAGEAAIDRCPPGGAETVRALAALLGRAAGNGSGDVVARFGTPAPDRVAWIDESACVGCFRCVEVCPVDAIVGAPRHTHTVLTADCTGCELCVPACPVDCITLRLPATAQAIPGRC